MNDHSGICELYPGLIAGTVWNMDELLRRKPDVIAVLDRLPPQVWKSGFEGEILYYPVEPYGVLPVRMLEKLADAIESRVLGGQLTAIFSMEDCGRIGYAAACALFMLGKRKPVEYLHRIGAGYYPSEGAQESEARLFCLRYTAPAGEASARKTVHIQIDSIEEFEQDRDIQREFTRIESALGKNARMICRFSSILPSVRVMVEAASMEQCEQAADDLIGVMIRTGHFVALVKE